MAGISTERLRLRRGAALATGPVGMNRGAVRSRPLMGLSCTSVRDLTFFVELGVASGTIALAFFTFRLAKQTAVLAAEGRAAADASERQHRQQLMPLCVLRDGLSIQEQSAGGFTFLGYSGVQNTGSGPALHVRIVVERIEPELSLSERSMIWAVIGPLGPNAIAALGDCAVNWPYRESGLDVRVKIRYSDIFEQTFETVYMKEPNACTSRVRSRSQIAKGSANERPLTKRDHG